MIEKMGDKATAVSTMKSAGVPTIPGSEGVIDHFDDAKKIAKKIGYPVMIKASAGGGGKGMRAVWKEKELFNELMNKASNDASDFAKIAMNLMGDELKEHQKKMIWSQCKTCHDKFRMPH